MKIVSSVLLRLKSVLLVKQGQQLQQHQDRFLFH